MIPPGSLVADVPPWPIFRIAVGVTNALQAALDALTPPKMKICNLSGRWWDSCVLFALVHNDLIEHVDGTTECNAIAKELGLQPNFVCRYLRAGSSIGVTKEREPNVHELTPAGECLRRDHPQSLRDCGTHLTDQLFDCWHAAATKLIRTGRSGVFKAKNMEFFECTTQEPQQGRVFDGAMTDVSRLVAAALMSDWAPPAPDATFCDVGGGKGTMTVALA